MIIFSDHAAWRTAERHTGSVDLAVVGAEIQAALDGGWSGRIQKETDHQVVTIRGGERFVVSLGGLPGEIIVVTALGRMPR